jgi:hypothetical protein
VKFSIIFNSHAVLGSEKPLVAVAVCCLVYDASSACQLLCQLLPIFVGGAEFAVWMSSCSL